MNASLAVSPLEPGGEYPLLVAVPAGSQRRWTAAVRPLLALPAVVFSVLLNVGAALAVWAAALVLGRVPRWLFDFQLSVLRWHTRSAAYLLLLTDIRPPLDGDHPVGCDLTAPAQVARRKVLVWKLITAFPHVASTRGAHGRAHPGVGGRLDRGRRHRPTTTTGARILGWRPRVVGASSPPTSCRSPTSSRHSRRAPNPAGRDAAPTSPPPRSGSSLPP